MTHEIEGWVQSGYDWVNREKGPAPDLWHDDGEYVNARGDPDAATHRGLPAIQTFFAGWFYAYPDLRVEALEIRANGDRVFVWVRMTGHGAKSGLPLAMELAHVWTIDDGKIRRIVEYMDSAEALAAAGLAAP